MSEEENKGQPTPEGPKVENSGMKTVPRSWMDDVLDVLEADIARKVDGAIDFKDFTGKEFARWVDNVTEKIQTAQKLNVINSFRGQYWVFQMNMRKQMAAAAEHAEEINAPAGPALVSDPTV